MSLMQQFNYVCNKLAKRAVTAIIKEYHDCLAQLLLREDIPLIVWAV